MKVELGHKKKHICNSTINTRRGTDFPGHCPQVVVDQLDEEVEAKKAKMQRERHGGETRETERTMVLCQSLLPCFKDHSKPAFLHLDQEQQSSHDANKLTMLYLP